MAPVGRYRLPKGASKAKRAKLAGKTPKAPRPKASPKKRSQFVRKTGPPAHGTVSSLDPLNPSRIPTTTIDGKAFGGGGVVKTSFTASLGATLPIRHLVFFTNTGRGGTIGFRVQFDTATALAPFMYTVPTYADADTSGGPTSGRAEKLSVTLLNSTQKLSAGGVVHVLNSTQRVAFPAAPSAMSAADWGTFADTIAAHPSTRLHGGDNFAIPRVMLAHPTNSVEYERFGEWAGTQTVDEFAVHCAIWPAALPGSRSMSCCICLIEEPPVAQNYTIVARSTWYTRWPLNSIVGQSMRDMPIASLGLLNSVKKSAEANSGFRATKGTA